MSEIDLADPVAPTAFEDMLGLHPMNGGSAILREDRFTLIEFAADLPPMLFDRYGKGEFENLADQPEYQSELARMTRKLLKHRMQNSDQTLSLDQITPDGNRTLSRNRA